MSGNYEAVSDLLQTEGPDSGNDNPRTVTEEQDSTDISGYDPLDFMSEAEVEAEEPQQVAPQQQQVEPQRSPEQKGNPWALARIAQRDAQIYRQRFEQLWNAVLQQQTMAQQEEQEPEEELPPFEEAPLAHLRNDNERILRELAKEREDRAKREQAAFLGQTFQQASGAIREFAEASGGIYDKAVEHIAAVRIEDMVQQNPALTYADADRLLAIETQKKILNWTSRGINPAEGFMDEAVRLGFNYQQYERPAAPKPQPRSKSNAVSQIQREKRREQAARNLGGVPGKAAKEKFSGNDALNMDQDEFSDALKMLTEERGGRRATIRMTDFFNTMQ